MSEFLLKNLSEPLSHPLKLIGCTSFLCQFRGLMFRKNLPPETGLLLVAKRDSRLDSAIHMFGMLMDLCIIWVDSSKKIVDIRKAYKWRSIQFPKYPAKYVLEVHPSRETDFSIGDKVEFEEI